jgi:hypothetical protein
MKLFGMNHINRKEFVTLLLCVFIGFALRFYTFDQKSLWMDEIYTYNDSRDDLKDQIEFYKERVVHLHPPLFFLLTHLFYPFTKPERDLRIIPLIFGTLSIPMIYFLSKLFSPGIALPCTLSLTFMAYHIGLSQDGRSYSLLMFLGMIGLYFFMKYLRTSKKIFLFLVAIFFSILFFTSYSAIPFIALSQILWFYRVETNNKPTLSSPLMLNAFIFLLCIPWIIFLASHYKGDPLMDPFHTEHTGSLIEILHGVLHDWTPHLPLTILSVALLILLPFFSRNKRNTLVLLAVFIVPIGGLYLFCRLLNITHFISSRYFINFLPLFLITLYLSLNTIEARFAILKRFFRPTLLFLILYIASNLVILPFYYCSEKQDLRGLVSYLTNHLQEGDKIFVEATGYFPGMLHYLGAHPEGHLHRIRLYENAEGKREYRKSFTYRNTTYTIYYSKSCCTEYVRDGSRLWIVVGKFTAKKIKDESPYVLKGYFDGSFLNFNKFPADASIYLFLWDPKSPGEKGIEIPID